MAHKAMDRINDDAQAVAREGLWVSANKDFGYDVDTGDVKLGQVFRLAGHVNDAGLIRHSLVAPLDPQPTAAKRKKLPTCGECGRVFLLAWQRERCGQAHELSAEDMADDRRMRVHDRMLDERVVSVGV